jgi:uncharacterized protein YecE (DUF72 family)
VTADFLYLRLHGDKEIYASGYTDEALSRWAARIRAWHSGSRLDTPHLISRAPFTRLKRDVYCYFDNDVKVKAPFDAGKLIARLAGANNASDEPLAAPGNNDNARSS